MQLTGVLAFTFHKIRLFSEYTTNRLGFLEIVVHIADLQMMAACAIVSILHVAAASESIVNMSMNACMCACIVGPTAAKRSMHVELADTQADTI